MQGQESGAVEAAAAVGVSRATLYRWATGAEPGSRRPRRARRPARRTTRQTPARSRKPTSPGEIVQLDTLTVSPHPGRHAIKQFTAHDPVAKWTCAQAWRRATAHNARRFLDKLQADMPFPIGNCFLLKAELDLSLKREYAGSFEPD